MKIIESGKAIYTKNFGAIDAPHRVIAGVHLLDVDMLAVRRQDAIIWIDEDDFKSQVESVDAIPVQLPKPGNNYPIFEIDLSQVVGLMFNMRFESDRLIGDLHLYRHDFADMYYKMYCDGLLFNYKPYTHSANYRDIIDGVARKLKVTPICYFTPINPVKPTDLQPIYVE